MKTSFALFSLFFVLNATNTYAKEMSKDCKYGDQIIILSYDEKGVFRSISDGLLEMNIDSHIRDELNVLRRQDVSCRKLVTLIELTEKREKIAHHIISFQAEVRQRQHDQERCLKANRNDLSESFGELINVSQYELDKVERRLRVLHNKIENLSIKK